MAAGRPTAVSGQACTIHYSPFTPLQSAASFAMNGDRPQTGFSRERFHVSARTRLQHARRPCRRQARSGDRRARDADLPDHVLRLRRCRPCRLAVRAEGVRQYLHPHHEPDPGGAGRARRRARRRHGGACDGVRPRRAVAGVPHHHAARRQFRRGAPALWRLDQPVRPCLQEFRLGGALGRSARSRELRKPDRRARRAASSSRASPIRAASSSISRRSATSRASTACR